MDISTKSRKMQLAVLAKIRGSFTVFLNYFVGFTVFDIFPQPLPKMLNG